LAEGRERPARSSPSFQGIEGRRPSKFRNWLGANWTTIAILFFIFFVALFLRSYFGYDMSKDNGYIVSGGSDSYYWDRIVDYSVETGKQLYWDPMLNYPEGARNPRPPFYSMSVAVPAVALDFLFDSPQDAAGEMLIWSTAIWGALTIFPTYMLGKESFGRRAGLAAALFLAIMPSHIQRSVITNADHDAFILFWIVVTFYFLLRALKTQKTTRWVENWRSLPSIRTGLASYFRSNRTSVLYSFMAGLAFACVIMSWVGFGYAAVIILAYYLVQVLLNRFKNVDSTGVTVTIFLIMAFGYLLSFPVYYEQNLIAVRFDVPVYLFLGAMALGGMFVVTRDVPWTLAVPSIGIVTGIAIAVVSIIDPALGQAILSGQGYFVQNKLYSTIAEARAPGFSELAMSFGMVTFFLALAGLIWAILKIPKNTSPDYILIVVWLGAAIFMAISAGRFMFNAAPAFAVASGWVLVIIVGALNFSDVRRTLSGASGSYWQVIKKSVKVRHVVGALFIGYLVVMVNVWYGFDAGIPSETKSDYDREVYLAMPDFLRPSGYDEINGTLNNNPWYFGAFGYSLPLPGQYFPAAWDWFAEQDAEIVPESDRPAYTAWWDYGFEAINEGKHPTVADNFQQGYQTTGNVIVAQSETDAIAIYAYRLIEVGVRESEQMRTAIESLLMKYGISVERMNDILTGPGQPLIDEILTDREKYGPMADDLGVINARIVAGRTELAGIGLENLVSFYDELCDLTGWEIRYFNADSRMFPTTASNTGIYYAPCKLADRRMSEEGSIPVDFFVIWAVTSTGIEKNPLYVDRDDVIESYKLEYKDMFYNSMFYRAMAGYSASDLNLGDYGIPGYTDPYSDTTNPLASSASMPGWNLTHFKVVYRTAYYNPYPIDQLALHRNEWRAVSYDEALVLKEQISAGLITGYVDDSASSLYTAGAVFLKYYHGAYVNGTVTSTDGLPVPGVRVTVADEYSIPHQQVITARDGSYAALAPFGNVTLVFSTGSNTDESLQGTTVLASLQFDVTDEQAMREPYDLDGDGIMDYEIQKDVVVKSSNVEGDIYWDLDREGNFTAGTDERIRDCIVYATDLLNGAVHRLDATDGSVSGTLAPGKYYVTAVVNGQNLTVYEQLNVTANIAAEINVGLLAAQLRGIVTFENSDPAADVGLQLTDQLTGYAYTTTVNSTGDYAFTRVLEGRYYLEADSPGQMIFHVWPNIERDTLMIANATVQTQTSISGKVVFGGVPEAYAVYMVSDIYNPASSVTGTADEFGEFEVNVPRGTWSVYATSYDGSEHIAGVATTSTVGASDASVVVTLESAARVLGSLRTPTNTLAGNTIISFERQDGSRIFVASDNYGTLNWRIPLGSYEVTVHSPENAGVYSGTATVTESTPSLVIRMSEAATISARLILETDVTLGPAYGIPGILQGVLITDSSGYTYTASSSSDGTLVLALPESTEVNMTLANSAYSDWYQELLFSGDQSNLMISAYPDAVTVEGRVSYEGMGLRNVQVSLLPEGLAVDAIEVVTGADGHYNVPVPPANYSVVISQDTTLLGGERYVYQSDLRVEPSGSALRLDIEPSKKVELSGALLGGSTQKSLLLQGPEEITLTLVESSSYSWWVLPGLYNAYATSSAGSIHYANMTAIDVSYDSRVYDLALVRAYEVSGTVMIDSAPAGRQATVTAVSASGTEVQVKSSNQGAYSMDLPPGEYSISYLIETVFREGDRTLYVDYAKHSTISVGAADVTHNPELVMSLDNVTLAGTVLGPSGAPQQAVLQLEPMGAYGLGISIEASADGQFSASVQPGDYVVYTRTPQDDSVALTEVVLTRNEQAEAVITMTSGSTMSGRITLADEPISAEFTLARGPLRLTPSSDSGGYFSVLLPPEEYTINSQQTRTENGMSITYSVSSKVTLGDDGEFLDLAMERELKRSVSTSWNKSLAQTGLPNVTMTYVFSVTNTGDIEDTYTVTYGGSTTEFTVAVSPAKLTVDFGTNNQAIVSVNITPSYSVRMGEQRVAVTVKSANSSSTKSDVSLYVNMARFRAIEVKGLNQSSPVSSAEVYSMFNLNNTGNAEDTFIVGIGNQETLNSLGWEAEVVRDTQGTTVSAINVTAFGSKELYVKFTAVRSNPDPDAQASVYAYSKNQTSVISYGSVTIPMPDLNIGSGDVTADRDDVSYSYDSTSTYVDMGLVIALAALVAVLLLLRRSKGLSSGGSKK